MSNVLVEWNDTACDYPQDRCIHELFEAQADRAPDAVAVVCEAARLSYRALDEQANQLAHHLRELGVTPDTRIAICMPSGVQRMVAVLATWKAGGAYVPLDPAYPQDRLDYLLRDSKPRVLLTSRAVLEVLPAGPALRRITTVDTDDAAAWQHLPTSRPARAGLAPHHLAYVIYTSGSTGQPKGVMIEHRGVCNLATAQLRAFPVAPASRILSCASFSFDAHVFELVMALCNGASLYVPPAGAVAAGAVLTGLLAAHRITHATLTPSVLAALDGAASLADVQTLVVAGEVCPPALVERWAPGRRFINAYGPTETTVWATWHECRVPAGDRISIGGPIANAQVYVLDEARRPVAVGESGELYVGGAGLARGYLNLPELTEARFAEISGTRLYRTGDLARWQADGTLDYLGRNDHQVKLRGLRIELGEIEAQLARQSAIREAAVIVREDAPGDKRLVAYVVGDAPDPQVLRQAVAQALPDYMVPAAYVVLDALPLTPNGKLDRAALPAPDDASFGQRAYEAPRGEVELALAQLWRELLRVEQVGRHDHFFELGGHSLLAIQMVARLGVDLDVSTVFAHLVLHDLAAQVSRAQPSRLPALVAGSRPALLPLSFAQQRMWFLARMGDDASAAYHVSIGLALRGALDEAALQTALERIVQRHEALRTWFELVDGHPVQRIADRGSFALPRHDLSGSEDRTAAFDAWRRLEAGAPFDLATGPLIRGRLLRLGDDDHALLLTMHHIVSDGWSLGVLAGELAALYRAYATQGVSPAIDPLPALAVQYPDYALWQRAWLTGELQDRQSAYWRQQLASAPAAISLPTDRPRPPVQDYRGQTLAIALDAGLTAAIKALAQRHATTPYMILLAAWGAVMARLAGQDEVVIGSPVANRMRAEVDPLIGFFVNTLALRIDLTDRPSVAALLAQVRDTVLQAQRHQDLPFEQVVEAVKPPRTLAHPPIFQLMFAWQNAAGFALDGLQVDELADASATAKFDLTLELQDAGDRIAGTLSFATALFDAATVQRYFGYLEATLRGMARDDAQAVDAIDIVADAERRQVVTAWNATARSYAALPAHAQVAAQAARTPDAIAIEHDGQRLTYGALDAAANRLAHQLRAWGVAPEDRVVLCLRRGVELVTAMLAVAKAGGAYVPLDPAYPTERRAQLVRDSAPRVVLTQAALAASFDGAWALDGEDRPWDAQPASPLAVGDPAQLAYVIYTSGSTGQPNGVMVEHRQLANLIGWHAEQFPLAPGERTTSTAGVAFDACTWEVWPALCMGATLVLPPSAVAGDPSALLSWWEAEDLQSCFLVTALAEAALARDPAQRRGLRSLLTGGDRLSKLPPAGLPFELVNNYGPTEATVVASSGVARPDDAVVHIGRPIGNTQIYLLDRHGAPVGVGAPGEIYIGGAQVARGYWNRPELTRARFVADPFTPGARMYRTGDLARWRTDGTLAYLGRNDQQVKIRGLRIELGEIEAQLARQPGVREAAVVVREDVAGDRRLVAYVVGDTDPQGLRSALAVHLPDYMVPAAYVVLDALPLTPNGKLDRRALPAPDQASFGQRAYEAPEGDVERALAQIWCELLSVERVGRHDHFFELGGHSLLAVQVMDRMRRAGLHASVGTLFQHPTLAALATAVIEAERAGDRGVTVPVPAIPAGCVAITPAMLPLVALDAAQLARIVATVPGGAANLQDVYPLAPLQEGILFHHLLDPQADPYLLSITLAFDARAELDGFVTALQQVIDRHDVLRTAVLWEGLDAPVQAVWREARLDVQTVTDADALLRTTSGSLELQRAPLMRGVAAFDARRERWLLQLVHHHLVLDHTAIDVLLHEIDLIRAGRAHELTAPMAFRNFVAQARLGVSARDHEAFFRDMLGDVDEPTAPFGLLDVHGDGGDAREAQLALPAALAQRLRRQARALGVTTASLFHWAWAQVLARTTGRDDVVFGTVLFGRLQGGAGTARAMGLFINTLPIRVALGDHPVEAGVRRAHATLSGLVRHEHASLVLAQRCSALPASTPLFTSMLNYRHGATAARHDAAIVATQERSSYPIDLSVDDLGDGGFALTAQAARPVDPARICAYMHRALAGLADALDHDPNRPAWQLELLDDAERHQVLVGWNPTRRIDRDACVHVDFERQVAARPGAIALEHAELRLTYAELNARANQLARHLRALGVGPDQRVAICLERGVDMVVAVLAVLKAGGGYVPLDPAYPEDRRDYMLRDSAPCVMLTQTGATASPFGGLALDGPDRPWLALPDGNLAPAELGLTPGHLAYVIYTSGSTGLPKGVAIEHGPLARRIEALADVYGFAASDRILQFAPLHFDVSVEEIFGALTRGATLVLRTPDWLTSGAQFWSLCAAARITVADLPTKFWQHVTRDAAVAVPACVHTVIIGSEAVEASAIHDWVARAGHRPRLFNAYGPTEALIAATVQEVRGRDDVHIGQPLADTAIYVLDRRGTPVPAGLTGELYIGGGGLARGYLGQPELTRARFVPDPFAPGGRMYRTGDLGRWRADGTLEYLGRNDQQVKIRGFRIELGEIEAQLIAQPGIREAVVVARVDHPGEPRLTAYVVGDVEPQVLRQALARALPDYMVPAAYVALAALPMTPSGKVDRRALPRPEDAAFAQRAYAPPVGDVEVALAEIWRDLLRLDRVGRDDNFFELGGHSLLVVQLMERLRREGWHADIRAVFARPTLHVLAQAIADARRGGEHGVIVPANAIPAGCEAITPAMLPLVALDAAQLARIVDAVPGGAANVQDIYPLAPLQEGILFHHLLQTEGDPYLLPTILAFEARAGLDSFVDALQQVIDRHDVLRTGLAWEGLPEPVQVVWREARLQVDAVELGDGDTAALLAAHADPRRTRMDVRYAPLMRCYTAYDQANQRWLLLLLQHHLAMDHVAVELILGEIGLIRTGRGAELAPPVPFRNFVAQARLGVSAADHEAFFRTMLGDVDEPTAPFGMLDVHGDGDDVHEAQLMLPRALSQRLRQQARALGVSTASLFHWAWAQVLARTAGRDDVVFGTVLFGRLQGGEGADRAMGLFMNSLPMRVRLAALGVEDAVRHTHATLSDLVRHEHAPLALAQRCSALPTGTPLFSALLNYRHSSPAGAATPDWAEGAALLSVRERTNYPFTVSVDDFGEDFELRAQIAQPIAPDRVCAYLRNALERLVDVLDHAPHTPCAQLDLLGEAERHHLLATWNATARAHADTCVHDQIAAQAARTPDAVAVRYEDTTLSYAELDGRAGRLARYLIDAGVTRGARVGIYLSRTPALMIAVLGVLKAGAAYVPLEPKLPRDRLGSMVQDAQIGWALLEAATMTELPLHGIDVVLMDGAGEADWLEEYADGALPAVSGSDVAYVLYTSGSTGQPKGVMVEHRGLTNYLAHAARAYLSDVVGAVVSSPLCFDATLTTLLPALVVGKPVWLLRDDDRTLARLSERLFADEAWLFKITPAHLEALAYLPRDVASSAARHCIVVGGEQLTTATMQRWKGALLPEATFVNEYGPTETVVGCSTWTLSTQAQLQALGAAVPIGRPIGNTQLYVLGSGPQLQLQPAGSVGELYIGGAGVARGYLDRAELTRARFVTNPFGAGRLYKTGDLVRFVGDELEFVGRIDDQVKIRGFRVELGEIEAQLMRHVREAVVVVREDAPGDKRLVAYIVGASGAFVDLLALRQALTRALPDYMVPAAFVVLDALPLTANGKLDRRALPSPEGASSARRDYAAPHGPVEIALAGIWAELLRTDRVGRNDHFFELGGNSLTVVRMISRLRQSLGLNVALSSVFAHPVLHDFARVASETQTAALPPIVPVTRPDPIPLSFAQQRLWIAAQFGEEASAAYHMPIGLRLRGRLDAPALNAALDRILCRHEALRTYFEVSSIDGQPVQRIRPPGRFALTVQDIDDEAAIGRWSLRESREPFDLGRGPVIRGRLLRLDAHDHVLLLTVHHIVSDGWSLGILAAELSALYRGYTVDGVAHDVDPLPALPVQYADYALWQRGWLDAAAQEHQLAYWCDQLAGSPVLSTLPTDHPRPTTKGFVGGMVFAEVSPAITAAINELAARHTSTSFMVVMAAFNILLSRHSGQTDLNVGTVVANRNQAELEPMIGLLLDTQAIRTRIDPAQSFEALLQQVRATLIQAYLHQDLPFDKLLERLKPVRQPGVPPLFQVMVLMQNTPDPVVHLPELSLEVLPLAEHTVKFDLTLYVSERDGAFHIAYEYDVALFDAATIERLAAQLSQLLADVVAAPATRIDALHLPVATPALVAPADEVAPQVGYVAPEGELETALAAIWAELFGVERVGRHDDFFELGGNSLIALKLIGRLRRAQLNVAAAALFARPTLAELARSVEAGRATSPPPPRAGIPHGCTAITPEMLAPLLTLDAGHIARIVAAVPGGAANVQDAYPLAPLQEGILFHHLMEAQGDPYVLSTILAFDARARLDRFVDAIQQVVDRHDVLRTSVLWDGLPEPVQVVWRTARFEVRTPALPEGDVVARLVEQADPRRVRLELQHAPLMRGVVVFDPARDRWLLQLIHHHMVLDHVALDVMLEEISLILGGRAHELAPPVPFRNFVAQARLGMPAHEHEAFFREMLGDVDAPTAPFGLLNVHGDGEVGDVRQPLPMALAHRLRHHARALGVSPAVLFHWAWAQVLARTTGKDDVVFGTVLFGRLQGGAGSDRTMGLFINTLPIRVALGEHTVEDSLRHTQAALAGLVRHEHASLALAQRCSQLPATTPLFSSVLNYRHSTDETPAWAQGVELLSVQERTNHVPLIFAVDDLGEGFELHAQVARPVDPRRVCAYMQTALDRLVDALDHAPRTPAWQLDVLDAAERHQLLVAWNATHQPYAEGCVQQLFERQVAATPDALAVACDPDQLSYAALDARANQLAHYLRELGVGPDDRVAVCLSRGVDMVVSILAVLKAGGAYVPLDPAYPQDRIDYMLRDSKPRVLLTSTAVLDQLPASPLLRRITVIDTAEAATWQHQPTAALALGELRPSHLAYVIYTSGSTGEPKGVMVTHQGLCNLAQAQIAGFGVERDSRVLQFASFSFDACISEVMMALLSGASLHLPPPVVLAGAELTGWLDAHRISHATLPPALLASLPDDARLPQLRTLILAGEASTAAQVQRWAPGRRLINAYGPTEATVCASMHDCDAAATTAPPIGKPIANGRLYILDGRGQPAPIGVAGELCIAGVQVARGYLNRPELTAQRFVRDPFAADPDARMYRTGDLARWRADGTIDFLGRNDHQVKVRGFRIELGEIEAALLAQPGVREALVMAREDVPGDKALVAYVVGADDAQALRHALARRLPDYMVPTAWVVLPALPVTPNGKIDRKALPAPATAGVAQASYEPPSGEIETTLAQIWGELLRVERVGRHDHFFELGGHSLLATRLISRVRSEWDIELGLMTVFTKARLSEFSEAIIDLQLSQFDASDIAAIVAEQGE